MASRKNGRFFKSPNLFFIIYIKLSRKFGQVLMYKAAKMAGNQINVNVFEGIFGHLNSNQLSKQTTFCQEGCKTSALMLQGP